MERRWYQSEAIFRTWKWLKDHPTGNCVNVLPTGAGKTLVMAGLIEDLVGWKKRALIVSHVSELLMQSQWHLEKYGIDAGIYCAGLDSKETSQEVIIAGVQSAWRNPKQFGVRDLLLIDECHRVPPKKEASMYTSLIEGLREVNPKLRVVGLTATPYRLKQGLICDSEENSWFQEIAFEASVGSLINQGFLSRISSKWLDGIDTSRIAKVDGDFSISEQEYAFENKQEEIISDMLHRCSFAGRKSVVIFCAGKSQAAEVHKSLRNRRFVAALIDSDTPDDIRAEYVAEFKKGTFPFLVNVNILTEGFDAPCIDCVVLMRATVSPGLYYQMVGRGLRKFPGKSNCLVLDYGENLDRHGPIDSIVIPKIAGQRVKQEGKTKKCPQCSEAIALQTKVCPECGYAYDAGLKTDHLSNKASKAAAVTEEIEATWEPVNLLTFSVHHKKGADNALPTLKVSYYPGPIAIGFPVAQEFICIEHSGFAKNKAERWWKKIFPGIPFPQSVDDGAEILNDGKTLEQWKPPIGIQKRRQEKNPKFYEIINWTWDEDFLAEQIRKQEETVTEDEVPF